MTERRVTYALKLLMAIVLGLYLLWMILEFLARILAVVYVLVGAVLLAYLVYPAVHRLRRRMPLILAIGIVYATIAASLVLAMLFIVPHVIDESGALVLHYPKLLAQFRYLVYDPHDALASRLPGWLRDEILSAPRQIVQLARIHALGLFGHVVPVLEGTFAAIAAFVVVPLLTAYLLLDLDRLRAAFASIVPSERWRAAFGIVGEVDAVIGGFVRGQLLVALCVGVLITLALLLIHVPYPFLLGLLAAIGDLIPYLGAVAAFVPAFAEALLAHGWPSALAVIAAFVLIYEFEGHFIAPNIVGRQVHLSPFVVLLAVLVGGELGGIFGMLLAIPIAGALRVLLNRAVRAGNAAR
jgi:predicted PurR-regulated permease PerM